MSGIGPITNAVPSMLPKPEEILMLALIIGGIALTDKERDLAYETIETEITKGKGAPAAEAIRLHNPTRSVSGNGDLQAVVDY